MSMPWAVAGIDGWPSRDLIDVSVYFYFGLDVYETWRAHDDTLAWRRFF